MELTDNEKFNVGIVVENETKLVSVGSWKVKGDIITLTVNGRGGNGKIIELTNEKLVIKDAAEAANLVLKKHKK